VGHSELVALRLGVSWREGMGWWLVVGVQVWVGGGEGGGWAVFSCVWKGLRYSSRVAGRPLTEAERC
jgi:hypothetical protein